MLGDTHYDDKDLREASLRDGRFLVTTKRGPYDRTPTRGWRLGASSMSCVRGR